MKWRFRQTGRSHRKWMEVDERDDVHLISGALQAYACLCVDGQIDENAVVQALLHGTEKNQEFLECMGHLDQLAKLLVTVLAWKPQKNP